MGLEAKEGARANTLPSDVLGAAKRSIEVTLLVQRMLLAVAKEWEPRLRDWLKQNSTEAPRSKDQIYDEEGELVPGIGRYHLVLKPRPPDPAPGLPPWARARLEAGAQAAEEASSPAPVVPDPFLRPASGGLDDPDNDDDPWDDPEDWPMHPNDPIWEALREARQQSGDPSRRPTRAGCRGPGAYRAPGGLTPW